MKFQYHDIKYIILNMARIKITWQNITSLLTKYIKFLSGSLHWPSDPIWFGILDLGHQPGLGDFFKTLLPDVYTKYSTEYILPSLVWKFPGMVPYQAKKSIKTSREFYYFSSFPKGKLGLEISVFYSGCQGQSEFASF